MQRARIVDAVLLALVCAAAWPNAGHPNAAAALGAPAQATESNTARRRRRRRRGRRGGRGRTPGEAMAAAGAPTEISSPGDSPTPPHGDPTADAAGDEGPDDDFDEGPADEPDPSAQ
jgi:hypothetical protein